MRYRAGVYLRATPLDFVFWRFRRTVPNLNVEYLRGDRRQHSRSIRLVVLITARRSVPQRTNYIRGSVDNPWWRRTRKNRGADDKITPVTSIRSTEHRVQSLILLVHVWGAYHDREREKHDPSYNRSQNIQHCTFSQRTNTIRRSFLLQI